MTSGWTTRVVAFAVVRDGDRWLMLRHRRHGRVHWEIPGGHVDAGESLEEAARREVLEETGVVVGEVTYFGNQPWPFPSSMMFGFQGRATTQELVLEDEIEEARWVTRAQMREQAEAGRLILPGGVSISRSLVETWYGGPLPGSW